MPIPPEYDNRPDDALSQWIDVVIDAHPWLMDAMRWLLVAWALIVATVYVMWLRHEHRQECARTAEEYRKADLLDRLSTMYGPAHRIVLQPHERVRPASRTRRLGRRARR